MIIVTCHTGTIHFETKLAIEKYWPGEWHRYEIERKDPFYYGRILSSYWAAGNDFWVVEPDIVIRPDVVEAVETCGCDYGGYPYQWLTNVGMALGCTWFRSSFLQKHPDAMLCVGRHNVGWRQLDVVLMRHVLARDYKEQPHVHLPPVEHLNPRKQLLPGASSEPMMYVPER